ncbi:MAG TPA: hypothetical protein VN697_01370 [Tepidiformaceae bacterium]|nr:hypothetical protein [Tepidiformaceae bacterium]
MATDTNIHREGSPDGSVMELPIGGFVFDNAGEEFANVKEVSGGYFKLDVPMSMDYWLSRAYVQSVNDRDVRLNITKSEAEDHKLSAPGLEHAAQGEDGVISDAVALEQRERMEREIKMQQERMRMP